MDNLFNTPLTIEAQESHGEQVFTLQERALGPEDEREKCHMVSCLLIDKNAGERHRLSGFMSEFGFQCTEVQAAEDGIRHCQNHSPDVVVMEASALADTREFLRLTSIGGRNANRPVVILYADKPDFETMGETILEGAAEFLLMPFDRDLLKFKLRQSGALAENPLAH